MSFKEPLWNITWIFIEFISITFKILSRSNFELICIPASLCCCSVPAAPSTSPSAGSHLTAHHKSEPTGKTPAGCQDPTWAAIPASCKSRGRTQNRSWWLHWQGSTSGTCTSPAPLRHPRMVFPELLQWEPSHSWDAVRQQGPEKVLYIIQNRAKEFWDWIQ